MHHLAVPTARALVALGLIALVLPSCVFKEVGGASASDLDLGRLPDLPPSPDLDGVGDGDGESDGFAGLEDLDDLDAPDLKPVDGGPDQETCDLGTYRRAGDGCVTCPDTDDQAALCEAFLEPRQCGLFNADTLPPASCQRQTSSPMPDAYFLRMRFALRCFGAT